MIVLKSYKMADYMYEDYNYTDYNGTWSQHYPEQPYGIHIVSFFGNGIGVLAMILNIAFLLCMIWIPNRDSAYNRFIKNLSICDIFGSFSFLITQNWPKGPFAHITTEYEATHIWIHGSPYVFRSIPWMFFTGYILTINCLTVSQYLASCKPHIYVRLQSRKMVTVTLAIVWSISSLQVIGPLIILACLSSYPVDEAFYHIIFISKAEMVTWLIIYTLSTLCSITFNVLVYFELRRLRRNPEMRHSIRQLPAGANTRAKNKAFVTNICLCSASVSRLPLILVSMLLITFIEDYFGYAVMCWVLVTDVLLLYLVFLIDPVVYILRMRDVRNLMKAALVRVGTGTKYINGRRFRTRTERGNTYRQERRQDSRAER